MARIALLDFSGARLRSARHALRGTPVPDPDRWPAGPWSQSWCAWEIGVSPNTWSRLERDDTNPSLETAKKICAFLDLSISDLVEIAPPGITLRHLREARFLKYDELATQAGIPVSTYAHIERCAEANLTDTRAEALAAVLEVDADAVWAAYLAGCERRASL